MSENLYIESHKYTNPEYRDEYERIFEDKDELECDIQTEKGDIAGD